MIDIKEKHNCCGCSACVQICPKQCISMSADNEGFLYPQVNSSTCIDCGLCVKVCPVINQNEPREPLAVYAAKNTNEAIRLNSSSGGIFTALAEQVIAEGGVVFGARFNNNWEVIHDYTETIEGLEPFRGSKYVQSVVGDNFIKAKQFLADGRKVLFSGTPCQIAGLKKFLRKDYENLLTVEVVCHGVPSPMIWQDYLYYKRTKQFDKEKTSMSSINELPEIIGISFRDKTNGWEKYGLKISYTTFNVAENAVSNLKNIVSCEITPVYEDLFMKGFLKNLYLRPSCYHCVARQGKSCADISIADYWGVKETHPDFSDDKGVGLILLYTLKGSRYFQNVSKEINCLLSEYSLGIKKNPCIIVSVQEPKYREEFWSIYEKRKIPAISMWIYWYATSLKQKCILFVKRILNIIINR